MILKYLCPKTVLGRRSFTVRYWTLLEGGQLPPRRKLTVRNVRRSLYLSATRSLIFYSRFVVYTMYFICHSAII